MEDTENRKTHSGHLIVEELQEPDLRNACSDVTKESSENTGKNEYKEECLYITSTVSDALKSTGSNDLLHSNVQDVPDKPTKPQEEYDQIKNEESIPNTNEQKQIDEIDSKVEDHTENSSLKTVMKPRTYAENLVDVHIAQLKMADKTSEKSYPVIPSYIAESKSDQSTSATGTDTERNEKRNDSHTDKQMHAVQILADDLCSASGVVNMSLKMEECNVVADSGEHNQGHDVIAQETDECEELEKVEVHGGMITDDTNTTLDQENATMGSTEEKDAFKSHQAIPITGTNIEKNDVSNDSHTEKQMHTVQILTDDLCTESEIVDISIKMDECNVMVDSGEHNQGRDVTAQETDECEEPERIDIGGGKITEDTNATLHQVYATMEAIEENDTFKSDQTLPVTGTNTGKGEQGHKDHKEKHFDAVQIIDGGVSIQSEIVHISPHVEGCDVVVDSDVYNSEHDLAAEDSKTCEKLEKVEVRDTMITENMKTPNQEYDLMEPNEKNVAFKTLRVVLIGQTGVGKSETGNTLLGAKKFKSSPSSKSCTEVCQKECAVKGDVLLEVLDTPGLFDTHKPADKLREEFLKCMIMTNPGPHAFLFILRMNRITEQEKKTIADLKDIFGDDQFLQHTIVVITRKEDLKPNDTDINLTEDQLFKANLEKCPALYRMISQCGNRRFLISNRGKVDGSKRGRQADELLSLLKETTGKNGDSFYDYQYFIDLEEKRKIKLKMEAEKRKEEKRLEKERKDKEILAQIKEQELTLKLELAEKERERERRETARKQARLEERLREEREEKKRLKEQRRKQREREEYLEELEEEKEHQRRRNTELQREARSKQHFYTTSSRQSDQWGCNVM